MAEPITAEVGVRLAAGRSTHGPDLLAVEVAQVVRRYVPPGR